MLRKMLTIEQYRDDQIAALFRKISFKDSINFQVLVFEKLIQEGCFRQLFLRHIDHFKRHMEQNIKGDEIHEMEQRLAKEQGEIEKRTMKLAVQISKSITYIVLRIYNLYAILCLS